MLAVNYTTLRENMKTYMDTIADDYETMIVTRKNNKNIVMLSEETYNNMMENIYVIGDKNNYNWLMESKEQLEMAKAELQKLTEQMDEIAAMMQALESARGAEKVEGAFIQKEER